MKILNKKQKFQNQKKKDKEWKNFQMKSKTMELEMFIIQNLKIIW